MNRREFIEQLRTLLNTLPYSEQQDALQFYEEYFDDAGVENEQKIIEELESPEAVAQKIIANSPSVPARSDWKDAALDSPPLANGEMPSATPTPSREPPAVRSYGPQEVKNRQGSNSWVLWLVLLLTSPLWFSLSIGFLAVLFSVVITVLALIFSVAVTVLALAAATLLALILGVPMLFYDPLNGFYMISMAMMLAGVALILLPPVVWFCKKGVPIMFRSIRGLFSNASKKAKQSFQKSVSTDE